MKKFKLIYILAGVIGLGACKKLDDFQINPNNPTIADPSLLMPNIERIAFSTINTNAALASRHLTYTQSTADAQYYGWQRSGMSYGNIAQVIRMEQEAARVGKPSYRYIGKFFRAYFVINMTETFGDIPYSQMMLSLTTGNVTDSAVIRPKYDKQQDIYKAVLDDLKIASDSLVTGATDVAGDIIYGGKTESWKKLINSYTLRVLMSLSKKEADATLNIKQRFNEIVSNPAKYPLISSNAENGRLTYYNITGNQYPFFNDNSMKTDYYMDSTFVDILQELKDPRLFSFAKPMPSSTLPANDFNSYDGLGGSKALAQNTAKRNLGNASQIADRYSYQATNEPSVLMSYAEVQFLLAEAVIRGWITGDAQDLYKKGIRASLEFSNYGGNTYAAEAITDYLAQPIINLVAGQQIRQIITQKYISMFMNTGWQPFFEQRRTGFPVFETSGSGILNGGRIPKRWMYPVSEYNNNRTNIEKSVQSQYTGGDNVNGEMWLIK